VEPVEWGEDIETGLLPNRVWLVSMSARVRDELEDLTADWVGPLVEAWRADLAEIREER
jgi:hypothetical protein